MTEKLMELYRACFPENIRSEETVRAVLSSPGRELLTEEAEGKTVAAAVILENTVLMLCVLPEYRKRGIGSRLLERSEALVREKGFAQIQFCDGPDYVAPGIPLVGDNESFFRKRGYVHSWGDSECVDMSLSLQELPEMANAVGDVLDGVSYLWAREGDREKVTDCVERGYPEFTPYYQADDLYDGTGPERVLTAVCDGTVCGTLLVGSETEQKGLGSVGCTVTRPEYRGRGIATNMVRLGTGYLKSLGLAKGFLGYTYTDIVPMYARSGYQVCRRYFMGKKELR